MPRPHSHVEPNTYPRGAGANRMPSQLQLDPGFYSVESGVALWDAADRLIFANRRVAKILGIANDRLVVGLEFRAFIRLVVETGHLEGRDTDEVYELAISLVRRHAPVTCDELLSSGRIVRVSYRPLDIGGWLVDYEDVTASQRAQAEVAFLAGHDMLTKLGNRALFLERLREALARIGDVAVLYLDLDRFKDVNDTLGHMAGDRVLNRIGTLASSILRGSDVAGRMGGDEFAVLLLETGTRGGDRFLRRFRAGLAELQASGEVPAGLGFSAGCANYPEEAPSGSELLRLADQRQYEVKKKAR
jgi:diguanylate cyclase (GGDEF)-like protein